MPRHSASADDDETRSGVIVDEARDLGMARVARGPSLLSTAAIGWKGRLVSFEADALRKRAWAMVARHALLDDAATSTFPFVLYFAVFGVG